MYERDAAHPNGTTTFIATLTAADQSEWDGETVANVTPDGQFLVFTSSGELTPDDSSVSARQVFRYDAQTRQLQRVSIGNQGFSDNGNVASPTCGLAGCSQDASIVGAGWLIGDLGVSRTDPTMSDDGSRVFFESPQALAPHALDDVEIADDSGIPSDAENVYEWEQPGVGSCPDGRSAGCVFLISDGRDVGVFHQGGNNESDVELMGTDSTGDNVFFSTSDQLVPQDTDTQLDWYDARVGGGFPYTSPAAGCSGDTCQGSPTAPPPVPTVATVTFSGPGNQTPTGAPAKVRVLKKQVSGTTFFVSVKVSGGGRVTITGSGVKRVTRMMSKAGSYRLRVTLTAKDKQALKHKHKLSLKLKVTWAPTAGAATVATVSITDKARSSR